MCVWTVVVIVSDSDGCRNASPGARPHTYAPSNNQKIILILFYVVRMENADCRVHLPESSSLLYFNLPRKHAQKMKTKKNNKIIFILTIINMRWERCRIPSIYVRSPATLLTAETTWGDI